MSQPGILDLPNEILRHIFSFSTVRDWLSINRVCVRFRDILPQDRFRNVKKVAVIDLEGFSDEDVKQYVSAMNISMKEEGEVVLFARKDEEGKYLDNGEELAQMVELLPNVEDVLLLIRSDCITWTSRFFNAIKKYWDLKHLYVPDLGRMEVEAMLTEKNKLNSVKIKICGAINQRHWLYKYCKYIEYDYISKSDNKGKYFNEKMSKKWNRSILNQVFKSL